MYRTKGFSRLWLFWVVVAVVAERPADDSSSEFSLQVWEGTPGRKQSAAEEKVSNAAVLTSEFYPVTRNWTESPIVKTKCGGIKELPGRADLYVWKAFGVSISASFHVGLFFKIKGEIAGQMEQAGDHYEKGPKSVDLALTVTATVGCSPFAIFFSVKGQLEVACLECDGFSHLLKYSIRSLLKDKMQEQKANEKTAEHIVQRLAELQAQDKVVTYEEHSSRDDRQSRWTLTLADRLNVLVTSFAIKLRNLANTYHAQVADVLKKTAAIGLTHSGLSEDVFKGFGGGNRTIDAGAALSNFTEDERNVAAWLKAMDSSFQIFRELMPDDPGGIRYIVPVAVRSISKKIKAPAVQLAKGVKDAALHTFFDASQEWPHFKKYATGQYCSPAMSDSEFSARKQPECQSHCRRIPGCAAFSYNKGMKKCFLCRGLGLSNETKEGNPLVTMHKWVSHRKAGFDCFSGLRKNNVVEIEPCPGSSAEKPNWKCYPAFHDGRTVDKPSSGVAIDGAKIKVEFPGELLCELLKGSRTDDESVNVEELSMKEWITAPDCKACCKDDQSSCVCSGEAGSNPDYCRCDCVRLNDKMPKDHPNTMPYELLVMFSNLFSTLDVGFLNPNEPDLVGKQLKRDSAAHHINASLEGESRAVLHALAATLGPQIQKATKLERRLSELRDEANIREFRSDFKSMFATTFPCQEMTHSTRPEGAGQRCCTSGLQGWLLDFCTEKEMMEEYKDSVAKQIEKTTVVEDVWWTFSGTVVPLGIITPFSKSSVELSSLVVEKDRIQEDHLKMPGHEDFAEVVDYIVTNEGSRRLHAVSTKTEITVPFLKISYVYRNSQSVGDATGDHVQKAIKLPPKISRMYGIDAQKHGISVKFPFPSPFSFGAGSSFASLFAAASLNTLIFSMGDSLLKVLTSPDSSAENLKTRITSVFSANGGNWTKMVDKWFNALAGLGKLKVLSGVALSLLGAATGVFKQSISISIAFRSSCAGCTPKKPWAISFLTALETSSELGGETVLGELAGAGSMFSGGIKLTQKYSVDLSGLYLLSNCAAEVDVEAEKVRNFTLGLDEQQQQKMKPPPIKGSYRCEYIEEDGQKKCTCQTANGPVVIKQGRHDCCGGAQYTWADCKMELSGKVFWKGSLHKCKCYAEGTTRVWEKKRKSAVLPLSH